LDPFLCLFADYIWYLRTINKERNIHGRNALQMKKKLKPVEGSADDDMKEIEEAN